MSEIIPAYVERCVAWLNANGYEDAWENSDTDQLNEAIEKFYEQDLAALLEAAGEAQAAQSYTMESVS
jgi:hypothetical protein